MHATPAAIPSSTPATKPAVFYRPQGNEVALFEHAYPSTHVGDLNTVGMGYPYTQ